MNTTRNAGVLRKLFIVGFAYQALDSILPDIRLAGQTLNYWLATGGTERLVSNLDLARFCFRLNLMGWGIYNTLIWFAPFVFIVLAVFHPRRWIFVTGSIFVIYQTIFEYIGPQNGEIRTLLIPLVLVYIARAMALVGFWVKPTACDLTATQPVNI
jgi:hypothetical protein